MGNTSAHETGTLTAHLVFVVKYRKKVFTEQVLTRCEAVMTETARTLGVTILEINGEADHVHLLIQYPPALSIATIAGRLKGASSRALRREFPDHLRRFLWGDHLWTPSYFATSTGGAPLNIIQRYIQSQARPN